MRCLNKCESPAGCGGIMCMKTELRPTPECDAAIDDSPYYQSRFVMVAADFARKLERERDEARDLAARLERENENLRNALHLAESAYRDAIEDAHYALAYVYNDGAGSCAFPFRTDDDLCSENRFHHVKDALDALKPLIND